MFPELDLMHEEERVKIWIPLRPVKVSGVLGFPILTFIVVWRLGEFTTRFENFI
jgi:hypothetical protein